MVVSAIRYGLKTLWRIRKSLVNERKDFEKFVESIGKTGSSISARGDLSTYVLLSLKKQQRRLLCCVGLGLCQVSFACLLLIVLLFQFLVFANSKEFSDLELSLIHI